MVGSNLIKPSLQEDHDDFEDDELNWPQDLPIDILPSQIIQNLPGYDEGAYEVDLYDTRDDLEQIWTNETINRE